MNTFTDPAALAAAFDQAAERVGPAVTRLVRHQATLLRQQIRAHASGRPGPNAITGRYRESWTVEVAPGTGGFAEATIGTAEPYGRRLEFGFVGVDSLGRHYNQPPFPHVAPAMSAFGQQVDEQLRTLAGQVIT
ncbi:HK97 gp10 family phage protein [Kitasatospora sp. NPDC087315]|uniref:HK97 gp10 family phage protein n=1 Tax=Kitasatospora sp. NPDC087315 TaxID=3364069 RepID=UPI0037F106DA